MSYKVDLSDLGETSVTQELVRRFAEAIDDGRLAPGERLPPTRELARLADVNPLTAARVYKRLRELGYLSRHGRSRHVRALAAAVRLRRAGRRLAGGRASAEPLERPRARAAGGDARRGAGPR